MPVRLIALALFASAGCVEDHAPVAMDAGRMGTDASAPLPECLPEGAGMGRFCPDGCMALDAPYIDPDRECYSPRTRVVTLCIPEGITYSGNGATGCFRLRDDPTVRVQSGTTGVLWEGSSTNEFARQGWEPCEESPPFFEPCE